MSAQHDLEQLDARLREELGRLARAPVPSIAARVLERLPERRARPRPRALLASAALAAGLLIWAVPRLLRTHEAQRVETFVHTLAGGAQVRQPWFALGAPLTPEAALREEAQRLVDDTRRAATSLWDRLPLSSLLSRRPE
ncbi:MAG TPA: hypothetical protein VMT18_12820 [Planctomycetota bacterium]|nr:hypothetical protein [Planctomycetota bacterium]